MFGTPRTRLGLSAQARPRAQRSVIALRLSRNSAARRAARPLAATGNLKRSVSKTMAAPTLPAVNKPDGEHFLSTFGANIALLGTPKDLTGHRKARKKRPRTAFATPIPDTFGI